MASPAATAPAAAEDAELHFQNSAVASTGADAAAATSNSVVIHVPINSGVSALPPLAVAVAVAVTAPAATTTSIQLPNAISVVPRATVAPSAASSNLSSNPSPSHGGGGSPPDSPAGGGGGPDSPKQSSVALLSAASYTAELERQKRILPALLSIQIAFRDITVSTPVPIVDPGFETIGSKIYNLATFAKLRNQNKTKTFELLRGASGIIRPGTLTLVLAPPGNGKSTLLKTLAGRGLPLTSGSIRYNGLTREEALANGVHTSKLVQYVDQVDVHNPLLSVKETFQFAVENHSVDPSQLADVIANATIDAAQRASMTKLHDEKADRMVELLGLGEAAATMLGNGMIRGVSGGQRRRVSLGEIMLSEARVLCLDEVTNGLDSSTAYEVINSLKIWAKVTGGSVVASLQQPTPEVFQCFDQLILLREGRVMYNGQTANAIPYLESIGYHCPPDTDFADFLVEFLVHPRFVYRQQVQASLTQSASRDSLNTLAGPSDFEKKSSSNLSALPSSGSSSGLRASASGIELSTLAITPARVTPPASEIPSTIPSTTAELERSFAETAANQKVLRELGLATATETGAVSVGASAPSAADASAGVKSILINDYSRALYGRAFAHSLLEHLESGIRRQRKINARNTGFIIPRVIQAIFMALIISSVFYNTGMEAVSNRVALIAFTVTATAFGNMGELPIVVESKRVLYKQTDAGMFPTAVYVLSVIIGHIPLLIGDAVIWSLIVYFMTSFTHAPGAFFLFLLVMIAHGFALSIFVRLLTYATPTEDMAVAVAGPSFMFFMSFGGYFITADAVPRWLLWAYHLSPFSWAIRAHAVNEFTQSRYVHYLDPATGAESDVSRLYLGVYQFPSDPAWVWGGILVLCAMAVVMALLSIWVLSSIHYELSRGTKRFDDAETEEKAGATSAPAAGSSATSLPFEPVTLSFHNLNYSITDAAGHKRKLLSDVSGFAKPFTLTALMGSSGAGKTTLLDVIAGRKTQGVIEGDIRVNGKKVSRSVYARLTGYVEQEDTHTPTATVRETLLFAANLRLPESIPAATKQAVVDHTLEILELKDVADRLIGNTNGSILGLSPGQLKRVTIGVELVANPTILFLDEPTTGLDSRSAYTVMRVIQKIAASGRSVVCTIHQPSAELFYMFDSLLLFAPGGIQTYFGSIGTRGRSLVHYFERLGAPKKPRRQNPATYMISILSENGTTATTTAAAAAAAASPSVVLEFKSNANGESGAIPTTAVVDVTAHTAATAAVKIDFGAAYAGSRLAVYARDQLALLLTGAATKGAAVEVASKASDEPTGGYAASLSSQFHHFLVRIFRSYWRNIPFIWTRAVIILMIALMYGLIYLNVETNTQGGVLSKAAAVILSAVIAGDLTSFTSLPVMMAQRSIFERERASRTYASIVHSISTFVVELPYTAAISICFNLVFYWMVGFENTFEAWIKYTFVHYLVGLVYVTIGHTITAFSPNPAFAALIAGIYPPIFFLFSGMLIPGKQMPIGWQWMWHATPIHHAFEALAMPQFVNANQIIDVVSGSGVTQMTAAAYASQYLEFPLPPNYWGPIGWLVLYMACLRIATIYAMERLSFVKR